MVKFIIVWVAFIPVAIVNGIFRDKCLVPLLGPRQALPLSGLTCSILFFLLTYLSLSWIGPLDSKRSWLLGAAWVGLTVLFEFAFGRLVAKKPWGELLHAYDPTTGNLWLLVLVVILVSPWLAARVRDFII